MSRFLLCAVVVVAAFAGVVADPVGGVNPAAPRLAPQIGRPVAPHAAPVPAAAYIGRACNVRGATGVCQMTNCNGQSFGGYCQGGAAVKCCVPRGAVAAQKVNVHDSVAIGTGAVAPAGGVNGATSSTGAAGPNIPNVGDQGKAVKPNPNANQGSKILMADGKPAPQGTPAGVFPWTFPYSQARYIVSDFNLQRIRLYDGANLVKEWKMSSGKYGIGFKDSIPATPCGKFKVIMKVGNKQPLGEIIEKLTPQHRIGKQSDAFAHMQTRILVLDGVDKNANYDNTNTRSRSIYIHGTNKEAELGTMQSHGCFRMGNKEVIELFDLVQSGVEYFAVPFGAWPN